MSKNKKRFFYGIIFLLLFAIEICIAIYFHDDFIRPYVGDIIVTILVYYFIRIFIPEGVKHMILYVFIFAVGVEVLQYFKIVNILGLEHNTLAKVIIGSSFDWRDIMCYGIGCLVVWVINNVISINKKNHKVIL